MRTESATMLNAKSLNMTQSGGKPELTREDLLGALSFGNCCNKYYRALSVFTGCSEDIIRLADPYLIAESAEMVIRDRWQIEQGILKTLCILAATELHNKKSILAVQQAPEFIKYQRYYNQIYACAADLANEAMRRAINAYEDCST